MAIKYVLVMTGAVEYGRIDAAAVGPAEYSELEPLEATARKGGLTCSVLECHAIDSPLRDRLIEGLIENLTTGM